MNKAIVMSEIDETLDTYCDGCFLKNSLSKDQREDGGTSVLYYKLHNWGPSQIFRPGNE